jgi:enoyl-CoA hydratase
MSEMWNSVAPGREASAEFVDEHLALATETLLDAAGVGEGDAVLDLAAGPGGAGLAAAVRVGPSGTVALSDAAAEMVAVAARRANAHPQVSTAVFDQSEIAAEAGRFDSAMTRSPYQHLIFDADGAVTTVTLNRPEVHNALDGALSEELNHAVRAVRDDRDCRVFVLGGAGETFCAGDDIKEFNNWGPDDPYWQVRLYQETVQAIEDMTAVTIAAVDGVCTGGGLELTLVCDFVIATERSRWGMPEIDWDITPGWGGTSRLPRFAGRRKAKEWNLIGALFSAQTAERHDLVYRLCAPEDLDAEVAALTEVMLAKHPVAVSRTKFIMTKGADLHLSGALAFEVPLQPFPTGKNGVLSQGVADFVELEPRERRRALSKHLWQKDAR